MPEHPIETDLEPKQRRSLFERLIDRLSPEPESRGELLEVLQDAKRRGLIDADGLSMIEGVFQVAERCARDVMVPRGQIDVIDISRPIEEWLPLAMATERSRFPAVDGDRDKVVGVLLAKDLLRYCAGGPFDVATALRPAVFIPESKKLNSLLKDFRSKRNHLAIVVDEYSAVAGLVTIEDVLEQIVGDIEDEYDVDEAEERIISVKEGQQGPRWRVKAMTEVAHVNEEMGVRLPLESAKTIGGLVAEKLGRLARKGDIFHLDRLRFEVLRADALQIHLLLVEKMPESEPELA